ncbi:MAG: ABC transporter permease [Microbacteriaceae bacterium]|nr:ABC transporter permease [Microbacteriaceae bacterium]
MTFYHLCSMWNWRAVYLGRIIEPLAYFAFLLTGVSGMVAPELRPHYMQMAASGILCLLAFRAFTVAMSDVANDRKWGVFAAFSMQGGRPAAYLGSVILSALAMFLVQVGVLAIAALLVPGVLAELGDLAGLAGQLGLLLPIFAGWVGFGAVLGACIQGYAMRDLLTMLVTLPVAMAAPLFWSLAHAPEWLRAVALANPLTYNVGWVREPGPVSLAWAAGWALCGLVLGSLALARAEKTTRER